MKTLIHPKALFSNIVKAKVHSSNDFLTNNNAGIAHEVGVFAHHRDAKVAIEELQEAGFSLDEITLVARNAWHHRWLGDLTIYNYFNQELFDQRSEQAPSFYGGVISDSNQIARRYCQKLFQQGKYLLLVTEKENNLNAGTIMGRRRGHSEVWYF